MHINITIHVITHVFFLMLFSIMAYHRTLTIVPCAVQQDLLFVCPAHGSLRLWVPPSQSSPLLPSGNPSLFSMSMSLFHKQVHLSHMLESTYKWYICLSLSDVLHLEWYFYVHPCCCEWQYSILFYGWVVFHHMPVPHLYSLICWWTFTLFPCLDYCK